MTAGHFLGQTFSLLRANAPQAAAAFVLMSGIGVLIDAGYVPNDILPLANLLFALLAAALQYWATREGLRRCGYSIPNLRFTAFFLMSLAAGLGVAVGAVLLALPGIVLFVRWSLAGPILTGSERGPIESLQDSWEQTRGHFWPMLAACAAVYGPLILWIAAFAWDPDAQASVVSLAASNVLANALLVIGWYLSLAMFVAIAGVRPLSQVFE